MSDNNKLPKRAKPQEFELVELLFREYINSHIARPDIAYSFQARFQSFIDQIPSYLHSVSKTGFFTHFFFGSFASVLDTQLADTLALKKLHFNFDSADHLRIVAETNDKMHVFIFTENNENKKQKKSKDIGFTKDEWKTITGREYTEDDNKKLEISVIHINTSTGSINVTVEKKNIQDGASSTKQYHDITKQCVDKDGKYVALEDQISLFSDVDIRKIDVPLQDILRYIKKIHDHYQGLPYGDKAREADEHGFVAGIFNNFRYRENVHVYLEQFAGKGYADIVLLVRGAERATHSIPIIIELKAGIGAGTSSDDALKQVEEYTKGFQPNNMRILSLADNILCVGMNLDSSSDSFMQTKVVERDQEVAPLIQQIINQLVTEDILNHNPTPDDLIVIQHIIQQSLEKTYNTFPGTGEKSSAHYMSRFLLGESLVLKDYDKHIFIYDKKSYIRTATVIDDHGTRSKKPKIEKIVDGSNAVNSILLISKDKDTPAIVLNVIDVNREINDVIKLPLDAVTVGNRKIISLDIEFRLDKYQEGFQQYCDVEIGKIYNSVLEYNDENTIKVDGTFAKISFKDSVELVSQMKSAIDSQEGLVISESRYKELMGKLGVLVYPIKALIGRESEFQGLLEGIFKYYSDVSLSEGTERRALVLTEFQTGAGGRIDMLMQAIGPSEKGTKEYIPVGLELKYDDSIRLNSCGRKQDQKIQEILLESQEQHVIQQLLHEQIERYSKGAAIKSITDGNKVAIIGVVFNGQAQESSKLLLTTNKFLEANIVHSSKLYTISHNIGIPNSDDLPPPDSEEFIPDWVEQEILEVVAKIQGEDQSLLSLFNKGLDDNKIRELKHSLKGKGNIRSIYGLDLSYNDLTAGGIKILTEILRSKLIYLDLSDNDLAENNFADFKALCRQITVPILKIADIGMNNKQMEKVIELLSEHDRVSHLEIQHLESQHMDLDTALSIGRYIADTNTLEYLDLSKCGIDDTSARIIAYNLRAQHTLRSLILCKNNIGVETTKSFKTHLPKTGIGHLDLSGNPLGIDGFANIVEGVVSSSSNVEVLKLVNVGVKYNRDDRVQAECLTDSIQSLFSNTHLTSIDISYNDIGTGLLSQIFDILSQTSENHRLKDLSLAGNKIDWGAHLATINTLQARIGVFLKNNKTIRSLDLSYLELNDKIGEEIARGLEEMRSLIHLDLGGNTKISTRTIAALTKTLSTHQYLKYLNLSDINLSVENLRTLLTSLKLNQDLTHINLANNDLSGILIDSNGNKMRDLDNQDIAFSRLLQGNTGLKYLNLSNCQLSSNSLKSLFQVLKENSRLEILDIRGNTIESSIVDDIVEVVSENASQGLNGIKILYVDQGNLSEESVSKLKCLGVSVLVDNNISSDMVISDLGKEECIISPVKQIMSSPLRDMPPMTLEDATHRGIYNYWLQQHDIADIARVHYHYQVDELEVVGANNHLSYVLQNYRNSRHAHPFTIILNIGQDGNRGDHWVSIVLHRINNQYHAYYTDSLGREVSGVTASILNSNGILIHDMHIMQQSDGHNCGLWALENASAIHRTLENNNPTGINLPTISSEDLTKLRRTIANELRDDDIRINNIIDYTLTQQDIAIPTNYFSNSEIYKSSALLLEECIKAFATLHILHSNYPKKHTRSIVNDNLKINSQEFLKCTDQMKTDITTFQLMILLKKFQIRDDNNCNQIQQFISEQEIIDAIKNEMPDIGFDMHLMMKNTNALINMAAKTHNIELFKVVCKRYSSELKTLVDEDQRTLLHKVIHYVDAMQWADLLIKQGLDINAQDSEGNTALYYAIIECKYEVIELLINNGANVNALNKKGNTLLLYSLMNNVNKNLDTAKLLIDHGANINALSNNNTVLYLSVLKNDTHIVEFLLDQKANVNIHNNGNDTALNAAIRMNNTLMIDLLLKHGANVNGTGQKNNTPIMLATAVKNKELVRKLIESGADVNAKNDDGDSAISIIAGGSIVAAGVIGAAVVSGEGILSWIGSAVATLGSAVGRGVSGITHMLQSGRQGYTRIESNSDVAEIIDDLINHGATLNTVNNFGNTPLHASVESGNYEMVELVSNHGININAVNNFGNTALHSAVESGNYEMVELVSNHGININAVNNFGNTALHIATNQLRYRGRITRDVADDNIMEKIIAILINHNANVGIKNKNGETAIYLAVVKQNTKIIELFLNAVQDSAILLEYSNSNNKTLLKLVLENLNSEISAKFIDFQDLKGRSILSIAVLNNDQDTIELLVNHGANINIQDKDGNTPLHLAAQANNIQIFQGLIEKNANLNLKNKDNKTPIDLAKEYGMDLVPFQLPTPLPYKDHNIEDLPIKNQDLENSGNHNKHRHHHGEWQYKKAAHQIDKHHTKDHHRVRRDLEDKLSFKNQKQYDKLVAAQEDIRCDDIVQVQHDMGRKQHTIAQDISKFIGSKASPVVNSVPNQLLVDWQGNLLLWYLLFGKKCSGTKCEITQDVVNESRDLEYAHRLAYSSYAPVIEQNIDDTELVGEG